MLTRDEREYLSLARSLAAGRGFVYDAEVLSGPSRSVRPRAGLSRVPRARGRRPCGHAVGSVIRQDRAVRRRRRGRAPARAARADVWRGSGRDTAPRSSPPSIRRSSGSRRTPGAKRSSWPLGLLIVWSFDRAVAATDARAWRSAAATGLLTGLDDSRPAVDAAVRAVRDRVARVEASMDVRGRAGIGDRARAARRGRCATRSSTSGSCSSPPKAA